MERTHILALSFPAQGHIRPMLQLSKFLANKGLKITLLSFKDNYLIQATKNSSIKLEFITKFVEENKMISTAEEYFQNLQVCVTRILTEIIENEKKFGCPISCILYDSIMPWSLEIAKKFEIISVAFFTQSCAVSTIYYHVFQGRIRIPNQEKGFVVLDGLPKLENRDLPSVSSFDDYTSLINTMGGQFSNLKYADWILFNSFNTLELEVMNWITSQFSVKLIGPTVLSTYFDKDNKDNNINLIKPRNYNCFEWLDSKEIFSVIYVAFGSLSRLEEKQMGELASCLKMSSYYFLWVVRESEENKLPKTFLEETLEKGMVMNWCPQFEVLAHESIGCFLTHCGWNSTLEALSLGVPMVAMPQYWDQHANAKFIADAWNVGIRVNKNNEGIVTKEELGRCIREVMDGSRAQEIRKNSAKWKTLAKEAVSEGGSSNKNLEEFVAQLERTCK